MHKYILQAHGVCRTYYCLGSRKYLWPTTLFELMPKLTCFQRVVALEPAFLFWAQFCHLVTKSKGFESNKGFLLDGDKVTIY